MTSPSATTPAINDPYVFNGIRITSENQVLEKGKNVTLSTDPSDVQAEWEIIENTGGAVVNLSTNSGSFITLSTDGNAGGEVTIKATANGISKTCTVTVKKYDSTLEKEREFLESIQSEITTPLKLTVSMLGELYTRMNDYFVVEGTDIKSDPSYAGITITRSSPNDLMVEESGFSFNPDPRIERHYRNISEIDVNNLNRCLSYFGINTRENLCFLLSQSKIECGYGSYVTERGGSDCEPTRNSLRSWFLATRQYGYKYRGSGIIQFTHREQYERFRWK